MKINQHDHSLSANMSLTQIYFVLGLAMFLVVLWDYKKLPATAKRLTKQPDENAAGFSRIALDIKNQAIMSLFVFFLWPVAVFWEITGAKNLK
jgi:hypothetical protein